MQAVAITDLGNMFGAAKFYEKAREASIKPLIGCEVFLAPGSMNDRGHMNVKGITHLVLLAKDMDGYKNLCKLVSFAHLKGFYYEPMIDKSLLASCSMGLIGLSGCLKGEIPQHILNNDINAAQDSAIFFQTIFGENNFFLEIQETGSGHRHEVNEKIIDIGNRLSIPVVATNNCRYLSKDDYRTYEILRCIQTGDTCNNPGRTKIDSGQFYFKSTQEMVQAFRYCSQAIKNTEEIAKRCNLEFDTRYRCASNFIRPQQKARDECLRAVDIGRRNQMYKNMMRHLGPEYVSQVIAFDQLDAKAVIRKIAKVLEVPESELDETMTMLPDAMLLSRIVHTIPEIREKISNRNPTLLDMALSLEGLLKKIATHPTVVAMADKPLYHYLPLCRGSDGETITQFDINDLEESDVHLLNLLCVNLDDQSVKTLNELFAEDFQKTDQWAAEENKDAKRDSTNKNMGNNQ